MVVFYHIEQVLNDLGPHTMSLKLQINLFPRTIIWQFTLSLCFLPLNLFWIGNETVLLALRLQMNSFPSLPESWPLVTEENDPNWIPSWAGREQGLRGEKMPSNRSEKGTTPQISSPLSHVQLLLPPMNILQDFGKKTRRWPTVLWVWDMILSLSKKFNVWRLCWKPSLGLFHLSEL